MRILRVIPSLDPRQGGPIEGARRIDTVLRSRGVQVEVVCLSSHLPESVLSSYPAQVHVLGPSYSKYQFNTRLVSWIKNNISRFDVVLINGIWQYHSFGTWLALKKTNVPYVIFTHGMLDPWFKVNYPLKHLKKWLFWPWSDYRVLRDAEAVLFTSEEERRLASQSFWLYRAREKVTAYGTSAPPSNREQLRTNFLVKFPHLKEKRVFLFLSRIHEKKGCDILIEAFAKLRKANPQLHLVIAGPDQSGWKKELDSLANRLGIDNDISWPGMLEGDEKWGAFYAAEVFCLPSHQENFGIVVAEAMACGTPVLISNKVNIWAEVEADGAGFAANDTVDGCTKIMEKWLNLSTQQRAAMGKAAELSFRSRFEINIVAEQLIQTLTEAVSVQK